MTTLDVAIVGAGPAGLAAATLCAEHSLSTSLYDEQAWPGGQVYRGIAASPLRRPEILGDDYWRGATPAASVRAVRGAALRARRQRVVGRRATRTACSRSD